MAATRAVFGRVFMRRASSRGLFAVAKSTPEVANSFRFSGAVCTVPQRTQTRDFGLFSSIKDTVTTKMEERSKAKQDELFKNQVQVLAHANHFDLNDFYELLKKNYEDSGMSGWRSMIPGVKDQDAVKQLKVTLELLQAFEHEHRANPHLINGKVKRKVSEQTGKSAEEINLVLKNYTHMNALRTWLNKRVERGLSLPDDMQETTDLMRQDPTGFPTKVFRDKQKKRRR